MWEKDPRAMIARLAKDVVAKEPGLVYNDSITSAYGKVNGYDVSFTTVPGLYAAQFSIRKNGELPTAEFVKAAVKAVKSVAVGKIIGNKVCFGMKGGYSDEKQAENVVLGIRGLTEFFRENGYHNVCEHCGAETSEISVYGVEGDLRHFCNSCMENADEYVRQAQVSEYAGPENVAAGILGALVGAVIGALVIALIGMAGFVASIGGVALAVCTLKGYEIVGKKLSLKGIFISAFLMIITVFIVQHLDWATEIYAAWSEAGEDISFRAVYRNTFAIINEAGVMADYIRELAILYLFTIIGAFPTIKKSFVEKNALAKEAAANKAA